MKRKSKFHYLLIKVTLKNGAKELLIDIFLPSFRELGQSKTLKGRTFTEGTAFHEYTYEYNELSII